MPSTRGKKKPNESYDVRHWDQGIIRTITDTDADGKPQYSWTQGGKSITVGDDTLERIHKLRLPPSWKTVWISPDPASDIQAVGRDDKNRKQYVYHADHAAMAQREKYLRLIKFVKKMPKLKAAIEADLQLNDDSLDEVCAIILTLVGSLYLRVGKEEYARNNQSYGITSLLKKHVKIKGDTITLRFKGKSNQKHCYTLRNELLARKITDLMEIADDSQRLFMVKIPSGNGNVRKVTDLDVNRYIKAKIGDEFSAKDFRTHAANMKFLSILLRETRKNRPTTKKIIKKNISRALELAASELRHTKAISKKSYVMDFVLETYENNPDYFIDNRNKQPNTVLMELLKKYGNLNGDEVGMEFEDVSESDSINVDKAEKRSKK